MFYWIPLRSNFSPEWRIQRKNSVSCSLRDCVGRKKNVYQWWEMYIPNIIGDELHVKKLVSRGFLINYQNTKKLRGSELVKNTLKLLNDSERLIILKSITGDKMHVPFFYFPTRQERKVRVLEDESKLTLVKKQKTKKTVMYAFF